MSLQSPPADTRPPSRRRRLWAWLVIVPVIAGVLIGMPRLLAWRAWATARHQIGIGALGPAQEWLAWSRRFAPRNGTTDLLEAVCFRRLGEEQRWSQALQTAQQYGAAAWQIDQERRLGDLRWGRFHASPESEMLALISDGAAPEDAASSLVFGLLAQGQPAKAKEVLDVWATDFPGDAHVQFMYGVFCRWTGDFAQSESYYGSTLARQPRYELARAGLIELLEGQNRLREALQFNRELAAMAPSNASAKITLARLLRKSAQYSEARAVIAPLLSAPEPPAGLAIEMAQIEFESGNQREAAAWFEQANTEGPQPEEALRAAGSCFSLRGDSTRTDAIFQAIDSTRDRSLRFNDLQLQLAVNPGNQAAIHELQQLATAGPVPAGIGAPSPPTPAPAPASRASQLYSLHCSACHGTNGDGKGHAARHLFPRPRDFRTDRFRLASTANGAPTLEDLERVNRQGMPGTTMLAFEDFTDEEHRLLAGEVMRLVKEGVREEYARALQQEGEEIDEVDLGEVAQLATTPGELIAVPPIGPADPQTIAAGKDHYVEWSCTKCHGDDGTGPSDEPLYDDQGRPTVARDLVHDPMRGGPEDASLYLRLRLGMPGTPHPACPNVSERQLIELLHYCRCLAREPKRILTSHEQRLAATMRPQPAAIVSTKSP